VLGFKRVRLACAERDDPANRIVRRNADGYAIARDHFDSKAAHAAAELGEYFVAGIALHAVETAAVNCHHGALHVDEIVLAQSASIPFLSNKHYAIGDYVIADCGFLIADLLTNQAAIGNFNQ
jgi:hypothetical protein